MQRLFSPKLYALAMIIKDHGKRLKAFREAAGLSQYELARLVGERQSNIHYWGSSGNLPRSNVLLPMAKTLGVTVEELLGAPKPRRAGPPGGKLGQVFAEVSELPRRQQQKVIEMAEGFLMRHAHGAKNAS